MTGQDPYRHHPELRDRIKPAAQSFFRDLDLEALDARIAETGRGPDWRTPCADREAARRAWLRGHAGDDLWVFGYGSLMWDPAMVFTEVRRARSAGYQRNFCLWDDGGRGSPDQPGLMLAIDAGDGCEGLAFRLDAAQVEHETFILFRREMIAPAYRPAWLALDTAQGPITALGFVADRSCETIKPDIPFDDQARMIATAQGMLGTNFAYLADTHAHLALLGIDDPYINDIHNRALAYRAST